MRHRRDLAGLIQGDGQERGQLAIKIRHLIAVEENDLHRVARGEKHAFLPFSILHGPHRRGESDSPVTVERDGVDLVPQLIQYSRHCGADPAASRNGP